MSVDLEEGDGPVQDGIDVALITTPIPSAPPSWYPKWAGKTVVVVASGPSVTPAQIEVVEASCLPMIVVNSTYRLAPMADVLYAADCAWWDKNDGAWDFFGLKVAPNKPEIMNAFPGEIHAIEIPPRLIKDKVMLFPPLWGMIGSGGNGGFQATNLAVQFGASRIIGLGLDYKHAADGRIHHHPDHLGNSMVNPSDERLAKWAATFDAQAEALHARGVRFINCSPDSRLQAYERMSIEEAVAL